MTADTKPAPTTYLDAVDEYGIPIRRIPSRRTEPFEDRFWRKVQKGGADDCWNWLGPVQGSSTKYGCIYRNGRTAIAHRISYAMANGTVPPSLVVRHKCDNGLCVKWLRTPYHHRGTIRGVGVDCAQFPLQVYAACGLIETFDPGDYPPDWHLHRSDERYLNIVRARSREIDPAEVQAGDFVVFRVGRCYAHGAIVIEWPRIIHAVVGQCVMLDEATGSRLGRTPRKAFTLWS